MYAMNEADEITRQLLRSSPDALVVVDAGGIIRFANETVHSVLGYTPASLAGLTNLTSPTSP
jgi:PAS domain S-box-containing protein